MRLPAEVIYQALFNLVCTIATPQSTTPLITKSRRWKKWDQIGDIPMPAFYQMEPSGGISVSQTKMFGPSRYKLHADLWFYLAVDTGNSSQPTSPILNAYFDAIDAVMQPTIQSPGGARQQLGLGPALEHAWIDGNVIFDEGLEVPPAALIVPVSILCGSGAGSTARFPSQTMPSSPSGAINFADDEIVWGNGTNWKLEHPPAPGCVPILLAPPFAGYGLFAMELDSIGAYGYTISGQSITTVTSFPAGSFRAWYRW